MGKRKKCISLFIAFCMAVLILNTSTALEGAKEGIDLCLNSVIPTLFPMFVLTTLLNNNISGSTHRICRNICKLCKMPVGTEPLFILGLLSGYPIGAQCVTDAYRDKKISASTAHRLLGFCSNAGPAFIFGMVSTLFPSIHVTFLLWFIHILAAYIVGMLLPETDPVGCSLKAPPPISLSGAVEKSLKSLASVCGWIILFRIIIVFIEKYLVKSTESLASVILSGILELTNGVHQLTDIPNLGLRFILSSTFLGLGGVCILLQTSSVTEELGMGYYFPGKVLHASISYILSSIVQLFIFSKEEQWLSSGFSDIAMIISCAVIIKLLYKQKSSSISDKISV